MKPASELPTRESDVQPSTGAAHPEGPSPMRAPTLPPACAAPRPGSVHIPAWYLRSDGAFRC